jgi:hypothetical protein
MTEGVVAFLDALGTKGIWARAKPEEYAQSWEDLITDWKQYSKTALETTGSNNISYDIKAFSDTVIITVKLINRDDNTRMVESDNLLLHTARLIAPMLVKAIFKGIYLRGVISVGQFYQSPTSIIGPAVDEAAEWYTNVDWIGVSASPSAYFTIEKLIEVKENVSNWFVKYQVPTKINSSEKGWAVNWPRLYPRDLTAAMSLRALILNSFAKKPISISAASKFHNTINFFDYVMNLKNVQRK